MTSPDLSIPDMESEVKTQKNSKSSNEKHAEQAKQESSNGGVRVDQKRMKMIQLSEIGEVSQSVKYIKKASDNVICKLYAEYLYREQDKTNAVLADTLIVKFADLLEMLDTVPSAKDLAVELKEDKLLQGNVKTAITFIAPFIPFIGLVTGGATVGKHVMKKQNEKNKTEKAKRTKNTEHAEQAEYTEHTEHTEHTDEEL